jgi:hypothetical protein
MAGRFRETDVSRNHGLENVIPEEFAKVGGNLASQVGPVVVHGEKDAFRLQRMRKRLANPLNRIHQLRHPFQREELALNWNQHRIGGDQGIQCE